MTKEELIKEMAETERHIRRELGDVRTYLTSIEIRLGRFVALARELKQAEPSAAQCDRDYEYFTHPYGEAPEEKKPNINEIMSRLTEPEFQLLKTWCGLNKETTR